MPKLLFLPIVCSLLFISITSCTGRRRYSNTLDHTNIDRLPTWIGKSTDQVREIDGFESISEWTIGHHSHGQPKEASYTVIYAEIRGTYYVFLTKRTTENIPRLITDAARAPRLRQGESLISQDCYDKSLGKPDEASKLADLPAMAIHEIDSKTVPQTDRVWFIDTETDRFVANTGRSVICEVADPE